MQIAKIEDHPNLEKDINTGAILLRDISEADAYFEKKKRARLLRTLQDEVIEIKQKIEKIDHLESLLKQVLEKL